MADSEQPCGYVTKVLMVGYKHLGTAQTDLSSMTFPTITRQPIDLERRSNPLNTRKVY